MKAIFATVALFAVLVLATKFFQLWFVIGQEFVRKAPAQLRKALMFGALAGAALGIAGGLNQGLTHELIALQALGCALALCVGQAAVAMFQAERSKQTWPVEMWHAVFARQGNFKNLI